MTPRDLIEESPWVERSYCPACFDARPDRHDSAATGATTTKTRLIECEYPGDRRPQQLGLPASEMRVASGSSRT